MFEIAPTNWPKTPLRSPANFSASSIKLELGFMSKTPGAIPDSCAV